MRRSALVPWAVLAAFGCHRDAASPDAGSAAELDGAMGEAEPTFSPLVADPHAADPDKFHPECDAGEEAWVRRAVPTLLGRQPYGVREVALLAALAASIGRRAAALALMRLPEFDQRWSDFFMDTTKVERAGIRQQEACFANPLRTQPSADIARFMREHSAREAPPGGAFNMADVLVSSLRLDDLTPFYRAQLFIELTRPMVYCQNLTEIENDLDRRRAFFAAFSEVFLHRNIACAQCHNADNSPTQTHLPNTNRYWPTPGQFEKALWGARTGRPLDEVAALFRHIDVVAVDDEWPPGKPRPKEEVRPWDLSPTCGGFRLPEAFKDDPKGVQSYFGKAIGTHGTVWDLDAELQEGFQALRHGTAPFPPPDASLEGPTAFASLVSQSIVQDVWAEVYGTQLTVSHGFPRNEAQRALLVNETKALVASGWSLRSLLADMVTLPLFNPKAPADACDTTAYDLPAVLNPWSFDDADPLHKRNGSGDGLKRGNTRALLRAVSAALEWPEPAPFPSKEEADFQGSIGAWVDRSRPGFPDPDFQGLLAWEDRFGACQPPRIIRHDLYDPAVSISQCKGRCDQMKSVLNDGTGCSCDPACTVAGDCCPDYVQSCAETGTPAPDWIDRLVGTARSPAGGRATPTSLRDLVAAVRDRLLADPEVSESEEALLQKFFGVKSLDQPFAVSAETTTPKLRLYCGVLLKSPQFLLTGVPATSQKVSPPRLIVAGGATADLCRRLAPEVSAVTGRRAECSAKGLSLAKK